MVRLCFWEGQATWNDTVRMCETKSVLYLTKEPEVEENTCEQSNGDINDEV
jgi:hypothetical protein